MSNKPIELEKRLDLIITEARRLMPTGRGANCAELASFVYRLSLLDAGGCVKK